MQRVNGMPALGLGTYKRRGEEGTELIRRALEVGYRHLDTAQLYENEADVGEALRRSDLPPGEVWITTKIAPANFGDGLLVPSLEESLERLGLDAVDLTLIHWPSPNNEVALPVYLEQLAEAKAQGLTRTLGVSNFPIALIDEAREILGDGEIKTNQVELHPYLQNRALADHCAAHDIAVTCYKPIADGSVAEDRVLREIADKHSATPTQVCLSWQLAEGWVAIPTTSRADRLEENFGAQQVALDDEDRERIARLDAGKRYVDPDTAPDWD
ncbi:probable oxidoreductase [Oceanicola granulosus HTCC2516]|uniref:Probable oxidoreductase n=1 Tax=Oceanicola granulosus (strain ATCC BAA-861 / DSM 15982 / KCTC 12143 / HTCC2516) TaxID=314256 RepID=Q2CB29_OCEGH|nr:2,5-didehydrogluconate reductase DkgB [Oceanicola granulosus]EAR49901.1 probable oxidoreductase [Oceanicola granulosus HTCC2516]